MSAPDPGHVTAWDHIVGWLAAIGALLIALCRAVRTRVTVAGIVEWTMALWPLWMNGKATQMNKAGQATENPRLIPISVQGTKELSEVGTAFVKMAELILEGVPPMTAAAECFGEIKIGIDGATKIPDEFRDYPEEASNTVGIIAARFIGMGAKQIEKGKAAKAAASTVASNS